MNSFCFKANSNISQLLSLQHLYYSSSVSANLPRNAKVVICGGGVTGASIAYHLAELGWGPNTVVLEQGKIGSGTTWHASGLVGVFKPSLVQVNLCQSSIDLYRSLAEQGYDTGWKQCGSLCVARTSDRMTMFRRMKAISVSWNIDCDVISVEAAKELCPLIRTDDIKGALWIPNDGVADALKICLTFFDIAKNKAQVFRYSKNAK